MLWSAAVHMCHNSSAGYAQQLSHDKLCSLEQACKSPSLHDCRHGVACCEAELDCLSGNFVVRRMDIVMDVGHSLAPNLDIGQIEGAVVQVAT